MISSCNHIRNHISSADADLFPTVYTYIDPVFVKSTDYTGTALLGSSTGVMSLRPQFFITACLPLRTMLEKFSIEY